MKLDWTIIPGILFIAIVIVVVIAGMQTLGKLSSLLP